MARLNKIWFRRDTRWWMVTLAGRKIRLAAGKSNRKLAEQKFHEIKVVHSHTSQSSAARVADIIDRFLSWSKIHRSAETNRNHVWYGQKFSEYIGYLAAIEVRPHHVTTWVDAHQWGQTTQRNARRSIFRAFSWAVEEGLLQSNPIKGMRCPGALVRQRAMTDAEFRSILKGSKRDFKILMYVLRATGCRPKEARLLTWHQVYEDRWVLPDHKTAHKTRKPRIIYLIAPVRRLMALLRSEADDDQLAGLNVFLNSRGQQWTVNAMRLRMTRLKRRLKLADDLCPYLARHAFGTAAVINGVDPLTVATLLGHTSLEMVSKVYVHLAGERQHLSQAAERAAKSLADSRPRPTVPGSIA